MTDIVDATTRSRMMSGIRGKNTKPELRLRHGLHNLGLRYRLHDPELPGKPDLVFPKFRVALFMHGCYWHRHIGCKFCTFPAQNRDLWQTKFDKNVQRDRRQIDDLRKAGWRVFVVWECCLRRQDISNLLHSIETAIRAEGEEFHEWPEVTSTEPLDQES